MQQGQLGSRAAVCMACTVVVLGHLSVGGGLDKQSIVKSLVA